MVTERGSDDASRASARVASGIAAMGIALLVAAVSARKLGDFDLPMHLTIGRTFWETGHLVGVDDFSYLHGTMRYAEVLSVSIFYAALRCAGPVGLQILGGVVAGGIAITLWMRTRRFGSMAFVATALAMAAMSSFLVVRSAELSFAMFAGVLLALDVHRRAPATARGRRALGAFVVLSLLWANVHGSVPFALVIGGAYLAHRIASRLARARLGALLPERDGTDVPATAGALALACGAASINPGGPGVLLGPFRFGGNVAGLSGFTEWARPGLAFFRDHEPLAAAVLGIAILAGIVGRDPETRARMPPLYDLLLLALACGCAWTAVRLLPHALLLVAPWIAERLAWQVTGRGLVPIACAAALVLAPARVLLSAPELPLGRGFDATHLPDGAARWAEAHEPQGHLWNPSPFGGYLAFRLYPSTRILMDGRQGMTYDLADVLDVEASEHDRGAFSGLERRLDLQWAVTRAFEGTSYGEPLAASADWAMVFLDDVAAVYVRRSGADDSLVAGGYRLLRHLTPPGAILSLAARGGPGAADLAHDGALARQQAPASPRSSFLDACGALAVRDRTRFEAAMAHLAELAPDHPALVILEDAWRAATADAGARASPAPP
jgi:hypothetical protein